MATKVKPTRLNISGTIQQGQVPIYVNDDCFGVGTIPTDNCQLSNGCGYIKGITCENVTSALGYTPYNSTNPNGYTTCTGTLVASDIANLAKCCDIPTNNNQLTNGCGYIKGITCANVTTALGYTPYNSTNPNGYTTCTGTLVESDLTPYAKSCDISEFEPDNAGTTDQVLTKTVSGYEWATKQSTITVTLTVAGWSGGTQTVIATGVTSSNTVIVSPDPSSIAEYTNNKVYCSAQGTNSLTFTTNTTPSNEITVVVVILN